MARYLFWCTCELPEWFRVSIKEHARYIFVHMHSNRTTIIPRLSVGEMSWEQTFGAIYSWRHFTSNRLYIYILPNIRQNNIGSLHHHQYLLIQTAVLQICFSSVSPTQAAPPYCGEGSVQVLVLVSLPPSQVTVHAPQLLQIVHAPSTKQENRMQLYISRGTSNTLQFEGKTWTSPGVHVWHSES